jgi:hypothetical protein
MSLRLCGEDVKTFGHSMFLGVGKPKIPGHFKDFNSRSQKGPPFQLFSARNLTKHPRTLINDENH